MFRKTLLSFFLLVIFFGIIYPIKKEQTKLFDYCFPLEKLLFKNSLKSKKNSSGTLKYLTRDIAKYGLNQTRGNLIDKAITQYKKSNNNLIVRIFPNEFYCLFGYWIEYLNPGTFENLLYTKTIKKVNELNDLTSDLHRFLIDVKLEYESIRENFFKKD